MRIAIRKKECKNFEVKDLDSNKSTTRGLEQVFIDCNSLEDAVNRQLSSKPMDYIDVNEDDIDEKQERWIVRSKSDERVDYEYKSKKEAYEVAEIFGGKKKGFYVYHHAPTIGESMRERQKRAETFRYEMTPCTKAHDYYAKQKRRELAEDRAIAKTAKKVKYNNDGSLAGDNDYLNIDKKLAMSARSTVNFPTGSELAHSTTEPVTCAELYTHDRSYCSGR